MEMHLRMAQELVMRPNQQLFINIMTLGNTFSKIAVEIIITILNYLLSKLIVFKD